MLSDKRDASLFFLVFRLRLCFKEAHDAQVKCCFPLRLITRTPDGVDGDDELSNYEI